MKSCPHMDDDKARNIDYQELYDLAVSGSADAQFRLSVYIDLDYPVPPKFADRDWLKLASDSGHPGAMLGMALNLSKAEDAEDRLDEIRDLIIGSVEGGSDNALLFMAYGYEEGLYGFEQSTEKAVEVYKRAVESEDPMSRDEGRHALARICPGYVNDVPDETSPEIKNCAKDQITIHYLKQAADAGDLRAMRDLGYYYMTGGIVDKNPRRAVSYTMQAAEGGLDIAQYDLAWYYLNGWGIEQSYEEAAKWFLKAADQGHVDSQYDLATLYYSGDGVEQSMEEAAMWFEEAAVNGHPEAMFRLGLMYGLGEGVERSDDEAMRWIILAAECGNPDAQQFLDE